MKTRTETKEMIVVEFVDRNGNICSDPKNQTIMMAGKKGDVVHPFGIDLARKLGLKVGDHFIETIHYVKV